MRLNGTDRRRITGGPQGANDPNVSPDGRKVSFVGSRDGVEYAQALFTVRLDGTGVKRLTPFFEPERRSSPLSRERLSPGCPRAAIRCRV
jgi:Tol biopolymer transport system component